MHHWPVQRKFPLPVPTTFLLDDEGNLAAIYHGAVGFNDLLEDARRLSRDNNSFRAEVLPFAGRWDAKPRPQRPIQTGIQLMDKGDAADAAFVRRIGQATVRSTEKYDGMNRYVDDDSVDRELVDRLRTAGHLTVIP